MKHGAFFGFVVAAVAAIIHPAWGDVTTITFGTVSRDIGDKGPITEGAYQYNAVGTSWSIEQDYGGIDPVVLPSEALATFFGIPPIVGNTVSFTRLGGGTFNFRSVDIFGRLPQVTNDVVQAEGFVNGIEVATLTLQSSVQAYTTVQAGPMFDTPIDSLRFEETQSNGSGLFMDNLVLQVPEPASFLLISLAAPGLLVRRRRRSWSVVKRAQERICAGSFAEVAQRKSAAS
jgi:hypothetical protein